MYECKQDSRFVHPLNVRFSIVQFFFFLFFIRLKFVLPFFSAEPWTICWWFHNDIDYGVPSSNHQEISALVRLRVCRSSHETKTQPNTQWQWQWQLNWNSIQPSSNLFFIRNLAYFQSIMPLVRVHWKARRWSERKRRRKKRKYLYRERLCVYVCVCTTVFAARISHFILSLYVLTYFYAF